MAFSADYFCCCLYRRPFGRLPRDLSGIGTRACPIALLLYFTVSEAGCHPFAPFYAIFLPPCAHCVPVRSLFCYILPFQEPDVILLRLFTRHFCRLALIVYPSDHSFVIFYRFRSRMSSFCAFLRDIFAVLRSLCTRPIALLLYFTVSGAGCHPFAPFYAIFLPPCAHCVPVRSLFCYILPFQEPDVILLRLFTRHFCRLALIVYPSDRFFVIFNRFRSRMSSFCAFLHDIFAVLRS